jgi:hypothetical protein
MNKLVLILIPLLISISCEDDKDDDSYKKPHEMLVG